VVASTGTPAPDDLVQIGTIERPHGLHGDVVIHPLTDFPEARFAAGKVLVTARAGQAPAGAEGADRLTIEDVRWHKGRPLVLFAGVETVEAAEALRGQGLWIAAADRPALEPGVFYETDLVGCRVETTDGQAVGTVARVEGAPGASVLAVATAANGEVLVPLAEAFCRVIDPAAGRIVIDPPAGLLELNVPPAAPRDQRRRGRGRGAK
jgi:16S rRNA processing protein RimM